VIVVEEKKYIILDGQRDHKKFSNFFLKFMQGKKSGYSSSILSMDLGFLG